MSRSTAAYKAADTRREREESVTVNVAPDLMALWDRVRWTFKGTPQERLEAFQRYVEEHPHEVAAELQRAADRKLEAILDDLDDREEQSDADEGPVPFEATAAPLVDMKAAEDTIVRLYAWARSLEADVVYWKAKATVGGGK